MPKEFIKDLENVEEEEDIFEKILNEEIVVEKEEGADPNKKIESSNDKSDQGDNETVESLKAKIAELERERKGQLGDVVKSRQEKQQFKAELAQLKDAVSALLESKKKALDLEEETKKTPLAETRAKVMFDETGDDAFVDLKEVKDAIANASSKTEQELAELKADRQRELAQQAFQKNVESVININKEVYSVAYKDLGDVFKALNDKIIELQNRTGNMGDNGVLSVDEALDAFSGSPEEEEFLKEHPGIDPTRVARSFNSKPDLKLALTHIADVKKIGDKANNVDEIDKLKAAKDKPGGLAKMGNQSGSETSDLISRISSLSYNDFEDLSDAEVAKIEKMLLREELKGS